MTSKENVAIELISKLSKDDNNIKLDPLTILAIVRIIIEIITKIIEARKNKKLGFFAKNRIRLMVLFNLGRAWLKHSDAIGDYAANLTEEQKILMLTSK